MTLHPRHVGYHLHAARILNWLIKDGDEWSVTGTGLALLQTLAGSQEERTIFRQSIEASGFLKVVAPNLFAEEEPAQDLLSVKIQEIAQIAPATARRRASTLLRWRTQSLPVKPKTTSFNLDEDAADSQSATVELHSVEISNFRLLKTLSLELNQAVVFCGEHSTGKSTVLKTLSLLQSALDLSIPEALGAHRMSFRESLWFGEGNSFSFAFEFRLPKAVCYDLSRARYEIEIGEDEEGTIGVLRENFFLRPRDIDAIEIVHSSSPKGWRKVFGTNASGQSRYGSENPTSRRSTSNGGGRDKLGFQALPEDGERFPAALAVRSFLRERVVFANIEPENMRISGSSETSLMSENGTGFLKGLHRLASMNQEHFDEWLAHVQEAMPKIDAVKVVEGEAEAELLVTLKGGFELSINQLSDGELRVMGMALLPYQLPSGGLLCIESPERGLHPTVIESVSQMLNRGGRVQVIVTTQCPNWIGCTPIERIRLFQRSAGGLRIVNGTQFEFVEDGNADVSLPLVFATGLMN